MPCVCSVTDHRKRQNVVSTSVTHSAIASCASYLFLPHFDVICDLLLNRRTATRNLFVKLLIVIHNVFVFLLLNVSVTCSPGWALNGTSCYYVYTDRAQKLNFWKANRWCKQRNSFLTSVLSRRENNFLDRLINRTNLRPNETFYVGLRTNVRKLSWVDGEPYNYTNWYNNSNDQELLKDNKQRCAYYNYLHQWQLNDKCGTNRLFICKQAKSSGGTVYTVVHIKKANRLWPLKQDEKNSKVNWDYYPVYTNYLAINCGLLHPCYWRTVPTQNHK